MTVAADNVTINLAGFTLKGGGTDLSAHPEFDPRYDGYAVGVKVVRSKGTRITGGTIYGFDAGVVADHAKDLTIDHATITEGSRWGVWAINTNGLSVDGSTVSGPWVVGDAVEVNEGDYEATGVYVESSSGLSVVDSTITGIRGNGVLTDHVTGIKISGSHFVDNAGDGDQARNSGGAFSIVDSALEGNEAGLEFDLTIGTSQITLDSVSASKNRGFGVYVNDAQRVTVTKVTASGNGNGGIWLLAQIEPPALATVATISSSTADSNRKDGIAVSGPGTWTLSNNSASGNARMGFYGATGTVTSSGNIAKGNLSDGFLWDTDLNGTSKSDVASGNQGNGVTVNIGSGNTMSLTDLVASSGKAYGLLVKSGTARVVRGGFGVNTLDGIRVANGGTGTLSYTRAVKNGANGVAFVSGSTGWAYKITSSSNGRYGICTDPAASYRDYPPHTLTYNGAGAYGHSCDWIFIPRWF